MPKEETMDRLLYTKITFQDNQELIILNRSFTKEEVKKRMIQNGHTENYAGSVAQKGIYTDNPHMVIIKAECDDKALLVEMYENGKEKIKDIYSTIHIYINPDATWKEKQALWKKLVEKLKK